MPRLLTLCTEPLCLPSSGSQGTCLQMGARRGHFGNILKCIIPNEEVDSRMELKLVATGFCFKRLDGKSFAEKSRTNR
ncbi:hypothetical protein BCR39DRAFT_510963 [Naematelia encephala]|uniref:Uncharacterized protein n=1 Tax=Naematelia encephala TaxID=71784 RepID=A0A1Y2BLE8_9TREE|nr:hypothetical protein BCR39DRAFT_510963 [Naematelia encephala]